MHISDEIVVKTEVFYFEESSRETVDKHVFGCTINIQNHMDQPVRLMRKHWVITDDTGKVQQEASIGIGDEIPVLEPQQSRQYLSVSVIDTPVGSVHGHYEFELDEGESVLVPLRAFRLAKPGVLN